ncbi:TonB-linked SusC/RagA family outer membrane protein [Mangrovibacterium diazotrophicum]|uniref:TonB-linked SusC/RagA family outer membrane protein n=2 Tax=Mangrovibacterium diazotrophicum TaxID=1261403 RepID=A0A419VYE3_9BACT|nr:TonB-linked SusC/RagA family outer membrane protein [Mangrovibacterium diazotrophicum]
MKKNYESGDGNFHVLTKLMRVMKLTTLFMLLFILHVSASVYSQTGRLSVVMHNKTMKEVLQAIESQSDYRFIYTNETLSLDRKVNIDLDNSNVTDVLDELFRGEGIDYTITDKKLIIIKPSESGSSYEANLNRMQQELTIKGTVTDHVGTPLPGVTIVVKGTSNGTITDVDGKYTLPNVPGNAILIYSFVGMKAQEVEVRGRVLLDMTLEEETIGLEEVVAIGYGVQRKSDLTGAISQVKANDMENRTITSPQQALQGKTAGVQVIQTSGAPGASATVRVRGFSSNSASDPLYIVDGLRVSDISGIDPSNIESMEVLKDAASAAIYGAEAGNGVILITTKKAKKGAGKISYDFQYTTNKLNRIPKVMNAEQYVNYMTEGNLITEDEISAVWDGTTDTDWTDVAFETSVMQKHNLSFQGANERGSYTLSLSYLDQNGIVKGDKDVYERMTAMINADYKINDWLKVGTTNIMERWKSQSVSENSEYGSLLASVLTMDPLTKPYYAEDELPAFMQSYLDAGKVLLQNEEGMYYGLSQIYQSEQVHPLLMRDRTDSKLDGANIIGTIYADFTPIKNLIVTSKFGYRGSFYNNYGFDYVYYANDVAKNDQINVSRTTMNSLYYQWENFANYMFNVGEHKFTAMAGISYSEPLTTTVTASGDAITKDQDGYRDLNYLSASAVKTVSGGYSDLGRKFSYFGRLSYNLRDTYLLQASVRRDASDLSVLPSGNRWGTFPAVSAGYVISNENFFPKDMGIDFVKLRASWGQNGSTGPLGSFMYRASIGSVGSYPFSPNVEYQVASAPETLDNPELKWETSEQLDLGFDIRLLNNRMSFGFDYFDKKTKDLLVSTTPPLETGVSSVVVNAGNVDNKGVELELGWQDKIRNDFSYGIRANLATLKNKVTYLDPTISRIAGASFHTQSGITVFEEGFPVWYMRGFELEDIDDATGDPIFVDQLTVDSDGDGVNDTADGEITDDDKVMLGSGIPDFTYGITITAAYKGFDFTLFGTGAKGNDIFNCLTRIDRPRGNKLTYFYDDRWTTENTTASKPRPNANGEDKYWISSDAVMNGSYFKVKQIQLGYTLPKQLCEKMSMSTLRIYTSFDDWFVITDYPGFDPEASAGSTSSLGVDKGSYPNSRKVVFGINVTF